MCVCLYFIEGMCVSVCLCVYFIEGMCVHVCLFVHLIESRVSVCANGIISQ